MTILRIKIGNKEEEFLVTIRDITATYHDNASSDYVEDNLEKIAHDFKAWISKNVEMDVNDDINDVGADILDDFIEDYNTYNDLGLTLDYLSPREDSIDLEIDLKKV